MTLPRDPRLAPRRRFVPDIPEPPLPDEVRIQRAARKRRRARERRLVGLVALVVTALGLAGLVRAGPAFMARLVDVGLVPEKAEVTSQARPRLAQLASVWPVDSLRSSSAVTEGLESERWPDAAPDGQEVPEPPATAALTWPTPIAARPRIELQVGIPRQLGEGGCCPGAWWTADGRALRFLNREPNDPAAAIWEVEVWPPGVVPRPASEEIRSADRGGRYVIRPDPSQAVVADLHVGAEWPVPSGNQPAMVSDEGDWIVWWDGRGDSRHHLEAAEIYAAPVGSADSRLMARMWGASVVGFLPDDRFVAVGRAERATSVVKLLVLDPHTGESVELAEGGWLADALISRKGAWIAFMISLETDSDRNGLWVAKSDGSALGRLPFVGAYRWRSDRHLVYVPMHADGPNDEVWQYDVETGEARLLLDESTGIRVANNDWSISPDGYRMAFRSVTDFNLWVVDLPDM